MFLPATSGSAWDNLLQLENDRSKLLLSANICRDGKPVFLPWVIKTVAGKKLALLALSSDSVLFDITDKMTSNITREHSRKTATAALDILSKSENPDAIILLSGLNAEQNLKIMNEFPALSLCLSGGDAKGMIYSQTASQIILPDGRQILLADTRKGYFTVECSLTDRIAVKSFSFNEPASYNVTNDSYLRFENRLLLWKTQYLEEQSAPISTLGGKTARITDDTAANLMRDAYRSELSVIMPSTIQPFDLNATFDKCNNRPEYIGRLLHLPFQNERCRHQHPCRKRFISPLWIHPRKYSGVSGKRQTYVYRHGDTVGI